MAVEAGTQQERGAGRVWTVRLDPDGRPAVGTVRLSCSHPACADRRLSSTAEGRRAAVQHVNGHLARVRAEGGPRGNVWCACRAAECAWHSPGTGAVRRAGPGSAAGAVRCGGPVVLTVFADRTGRLWRVAEMCARCAAAHSDCRVVDTAPLPGRAGTPGTRRAGEAPATAAGHAAGRAGEGMTAVFSDHGSVAAAGVPPAPAATSGSVPHARRASAAARPRRAKRRGKIAQRIVPHDLSPDALRVDLIELGDAFRAYQRRPEPDLALLAELHERKARAFRLWADVSGDSSLREEAHRAEKAAETTREMHANRTGQPLGGTADGDGPAVDWLLTRNQAVHARTVLGYAAAHAPYPEAEVRLAVVMLTLRAARAGTGNIAGQELTGWLRDDAEEVLQRLVTADWLRLPGTVAEAMASRPENPTAITVPALLAEEPRPLGFGKTTRARLSGWAQKVVGDRKVRKKKLSAATRLLALYTAAHARPDGHLGPAEQDGLDMDEVAAFCTVPSGQVAEHAGLLVTADWLAEADTSSGRLCGRLTERVLPLGGLL